MGNITFPSGDTIFFSSFGTSAGTDAAAWLYVTYWLFGRLEWAHQEWSHHREFVWRNQLR